MPKSSNAQVFYIKCHNQLFIPADMVPMDTEGITQEESDGKMHWARSRESVLISMPFLRAPLSSNLHVVNNAELS